MKLLSKLVKTVFGIKTRRPLFGLTFIYILYCYSFPYRFKCGISSNVRRRRAEIQAELSAALHKNVKVRIAVAVPSVFSESNEARIHGWLKFLNDRDMPYHRGYKEWFYYLNPLGGLILYWLGIRYGLKVETCHIALICCVPFYPVDAVLIVLFVLFIEICIIVGAIILALYLFTNLLTF